MSVPGSSRRSAARIDGTVRVDWSAGLRHLFWCPDGIRRGFNLEANSAAVKSATGRCPRCWVNWRRAQPGVALVYVIWKAPRSQECYVGQAGDAESRFYRHFMYGEIPFLPTIERFEEMVRKGEPAPYVEIVDAVPRATALKREREVASDLAKRGFEVFGGR